MALRGNKTAVRIFVLLQIVLVLLGLFQIIATIYLSLYGPKAAISEPSRILTLICALLSVFFPFLRWQLGQHRSNKTLQAWRRDLHPASILFLCVLLCLWIAAEPAAVIKAFDYEHCNASKESVRGTVQASACLLDRIKAILAAVMAAITFALLLFLTCSNSLYPKPCPCKQREKTDEARLPSHLRDTSFRSFSDSQTLRPSYDVEYLYPKMRPPIMPRPQRQTRFNLLPKLPPFDQLTPLDLDHPSLHPFPAQQLAPPQDVIDCSVNTSQACLLPSPVALSTMIPLPLRPTRTTSMGSHPPLSRSLTARTVASSIYSRSISTDELFSRDPSPDTSMSDASHTGLASDSIRLQTKSPFRPPTPHNQLTRQITTVKPARPQSRPGMPPASFWMYAQKVQEEHDSSCGKAIDIETSFVNDMKSVTPHKRNAKSMTQNTLVSGEEGSPSYERYRKGPRATSPLWSGKSDFDRRLAAAIAETKTNTDRSVQRAKTSGGKVSKSHHWPTAAF